MNQPRPNLDELRLALVQEIADKVLARGKASDDWERFHFGVAIAYFARNVQQHDAGSEQWLRPAKVALEKACSPREERAPDEEAMPAGQQIPTYEQIIDDLRNLGAKVY